MSGRAWQAMGRLALAGMTLALGACAEDDWQPVYDPPELAAAVTRPPLTNEAGWGGSVAIPATGPLELTVEDAVLLALEHNRALRVERLNPSIQRTFIEQEWAVFDPVLSAEGSARRERGATGGRDTATGLSAGLEQYLPSGTTVGADLSTDRIYGTGRADRHATRAGLSVTQALLRGRGVAVNLVDLRQARLDTLFSEYEFRGFVEALVAEVETTYWQYVLARRQVEIVAESLRVAEQQLEEMRQRIRVGGLAETELAAAEAEIALRRENLINARGRTATLEVLLLRLVLPQALPAGTRAIVPRTDPAVPPLPLEALESHVAVALELRPELRQAALLVQRGELEIVRTRNGLLPRMDLFVTLGKTGYAESFGGSVGDLDGDGYDLFAAVRFEYPLRNRDAEARHTRALLTREQRERSLENLRDLVRQDVALAYIEVERARQQVDATAVTRRFQEEKLRAESAKFRVGRSTALLVATAQRDLLVSQVAEVQALTTYLNARVELYRMEGSLLARRGLAAPGLALLPAAAEPAAPDQPAPVPEVPDPAAPDRPGPVPPEEPQTIPAAVP